MVEGVDASPLPDAPQDLCFNKDDFMKEEFHVDEFIASCRKKVSLEALRDDLGTYLKVLKSAMIELINKDYADYVNLSTNLVGMDKTINNLTVPLGQLKEEVLSVRTAINATIEAVQAKMDQRAAIKEKRACLQRLRNIILTVNKIEKLLGIQKSEELLSITDGQLLERVATEFNKLQFYVSKCRGTALVRDVQPRLDTITTTLQYRLEVLFRDGLISGDVTMLSQCLRTYTTIDRTAVAEQLFRVLVVKPYMDEIVTEQFLKNNGAGIQGLYAKVLEFVPLHCKRLKNITSGAISGSEVVRGYDFLVNAVWPEIISGLDTRLNIIYSTSNTQAFHQNYCWSIDFLDKFERCCGSLASVKRLRAHQSYKSFLNKWNLNAYYQARFMEIASPLETALNTGLNKLPEDQESEFHLESTSVVWLLLHRCWADTVYLPAIAGQLWKLSLQLVARYVSYIKELQEVQPKPRSKTPDQTSTTRSKTPDQSSTRSKTPENQSRSKTPDSDKSEELPRQESAVTVGQILLLIADGEKLAKMLPDMYSSVIKPRFDQLGCGDKPSVKESLDDCQSNLRRQLCKFDDQIIHELTEECAAHLRCVNDIPRLYRRTNREIPCKPSLYVASIARPLDSFISEHGSYMDADKRHEWFLAVLDTTITQYTTLTTDVLTSVRKMEDSLKRLKKARGSVTSLNITGMSDDDKIRRQIALDVQGLQEEVTRLAPQISSLESFEKLGAVLDLCTTSSEPPRAGGLFHMSASTPNFDLGGDHGLGLGQSPNPEVTIKGSSPPRSPSQSPKSQSPLASPKAARRGPARSPLASPKLPRKSPLTIPEGEHGDENVE